jgi:imidazolonepropionase
MQADGLDDVPNTAHPEHEALQRTRRTPQEDGVGSREDCLKAYRAARLVTCGDLGVIEDGVVAFAGETLAYVGAASGYTGTTEPAALITPGLIDAHTHAAWVGSRHDEYLLRLSGAHYTDIAKAGGGIAASRRAVASASQAEIERTLTERLLRMAQLGVTTVEVKSGYGLLPDEELKQLRAIAAVAQRRDVPRVVATALLLHALPAEYRDARAQYVALMVGDCLNRVAKEALATFVDAYVDQNAFTVHEAENLANAATALGLKVRLHIGQFADVGGAELAARVGAKSADHLEHISEMGARALANGNVVAGLLPTACFTLGQTPPPVERLRAAGVAMMIASDANPGTAPTESLPLAMAMAARTYGMTLSEILLGVTHVAARSLDLPDRGALHVGAASDFVVWDLPHEACLLQPWGTSRVQKSYARGLPLVG